MIWHLTKCYCAQATGKGGWGGATACPGAGAAFEAGEARQGPYTTKCDTRAAPTPIPPPPRRPPPGYTVEFGVVREGDATKAFGAGVLSSYGELQWMASGQAQFTPFDPYAKQPKMRCGAARAGACVSKPPPPPRAARRAPGALRTGPPSQSGRPANAPPPCAARAPPPPARPQLQGRLPEALLCARQLRRGRAPAAGLRGRARAAARRGQRQDVLALSARAAARLAPPVRFTSPLQTRRAARRAAAAAPRRLYQQGPAPASA